jgi:hypothetical protein
VINSLRATFGFPFSYSEFGIHKNANLVQPSKESFGISPLSEDIMQNLGIQKPSCDIPKRNYYGITEISALSIITGSTFQESGTQYKFVSRCQKSAFGILPVHTHQEKAMFNFLLPHRFPEHKTHSIDFVMFAQIWSSYADGKYIFYKTPEHLRSRYNI